MAASAIILALDLAKMPSMAAAVRQQPLPADVAVVIRIAGGCEDTLRDAAAATRTSRRALRAAAIFYIQEVLFQVGADHYRVLGATPGASREQIRENMRWLLKWLHPDRNGDALEAAFADRVLSAWRSLASPQNRSAYDSSMRQARPATPRPMLPPGLPPIRWVPKPYVAPKRQGWLSRTGLRRLAVACIVFAVGLVLLPGSFGRVSQWLGIASNIPAQENPAPREAAAR